MKTSFLILILVYIFSYQKNKTDMFRKAWLLSNIVYDSNVKGFHSISGIDIVDFSDDKILTYKGFDDKEPRHYSYELDEFNTIKLKDHPFTSNIIQASEDILTIKMDIATVTYTPLVSSNTILSIEEIRKMLISSNWIYNSYNKSALIKFLDKPTDSWLEYKNLILEDGDSSVTDISMELFNNQIEQKVCFIPKDTLPENYPGMWFLNQYKDTYLLTFSTNADHKLITCQLQTLMSDKITAVRWENGNLKKIEFIKTKNH